MGLAAGRPTLATACQLAVSALANPTTSFCSPRTSAGILPSDAVDARRRGLSEALAALSALVAADPGSARRQEALDNNLQIRSSKEHLSNLLEMLARVTGKCARAPLDAQTAATVGPVQFWEHCPWIGSRPAC